MNKKTLIIISITAILLIGSLIYINRNTSQCEIGKITYYYHIGCSFCELVEKDKTIDKLEALGVKIEKIDTNIGPIRHQIQGTPAFVIKGKVYEGYKPYEEIAGLLSCPVK